MPSVSSIVLAATALVATAQSAEFQIYAYGPNIGGVPLFSAGSTAYVGDHTALNNTEASPVIFTRNGSSWTGAPNKTAAPDPSTPPTWSGLTFGVPSSSSSSHGVEFMSANSSNSSFVTDRSMLYGSYVGVNSDANQMEMLWYATPSETDGVYSLQWNETGDETADKVLLSLRTTAPSNKVDDDDE